MGASSSRKQSSRGSGRTVYSVVALLPTGDAPAIELPGSETLYQVEEQAYAVYTSTATAVEAARLAVRNGVSRASAIVTGEFGSSATELNEEAYALAHWALGTAEAGRVVLDLTTLELVRGALDVSAEVLDMGTYSRDDSDRRERLYTLVERRAEPETVAVVPSRMRDVCFVGREKDLIELKRYLGLARVVTVVGPSGIGKSALLMRLVEEVEEQFEDGATVIGLRDVAHDDLVAPTVSRFLGVPSTPGRSSIDGLIEFLGNKSLLLVLDGCERVIRGVRALVAAISPHCPNVQWLVGSHRAMRLPSEARYPLAGLETPSLAEGLEAIAGYDAVALFVDRAQLVDPGFRLNSENAVQVATLCQRLEGVPLAIELAASKANMLTPLQMVGRMDHRFALLKDPTRTGHHAALRTALEWNYSLLSPAAQVLFRRLSIFEGAFSVDDAEAVCTDPVALPSWSLFTALEELVDCSMIRIAANGLERRFSLGETARLFAEEMRNGADETPMLSAAMRGWFIQMVGRAEGEWAGERQALWIERIESLYPDIRGMFLRGLRDRRTCEETLRLLLQVYPFWFGRGYLAEALFLVETALNQPGVSDLGSYSRIVNLASAISATMGDYKKARRYARASLEEAIRTKDEHAVACSWSGLGMAAAIAGRHRTAIQCQNRAAKVFRTLSDESRLLRVLVNLIGLRIPLGQFEEARREFLEVQTLNIDSLDPFSRAVLHQNGGYLLAMWGDGATSLQQLNEAIARFNALDAQIYIGRCFRAAAHAFLIHDRNEDACRAYGAAAARQSNSAVEILPHEMHRLESNLALLRERLGALRVTELLIEGQFMEPEEALKPLIHI